jgi:hypothetical protein
MKKIFFWLVVVLVVVVLAAVVFVGFFLDSTVKREVETLGPQYTKVSVTLDAFSLSLFSGSGKLTKFVIGNPQGFKSPFSISMDTASLSVSPASVFADKVVIKSIDIQAPQITFETDLTGNNLKKILNNLQDTTGGGTNTPAKPAEPQTASGKPAKKLQVDDFLINGGKVQLTVNTPVGSKSATLSIPQIHLTKLGQGPEGITGPELAKLALAAIEEEAAKVAASAIPELQRGALFMSNDSSKSATNTVEKATKSLGDFFKKK